MPSSISPAPATQPLGLEAVRRMRGMTLRELSIATGYHYSWISRIERGLVPPWPEFRRRIAEALGTDESLLFTPVPASRRASAARAEAAGHAE